MTRPLSIIIATRDRAAVLPEAIRSVLAQDVSDFELLIVDDGSTDVTEEVVQAFADDRIRYLRQEPAGVSAARNFGAAEAVGRFLTFLDDDDLALPTWVSSFERATLEPDTAAVCCGATFVDSNGRVVRERLPGRLGPLFDQQVGLFWPPGTFAIRRDVFEGVGGYVAGLLASENFELAMRLVPAMIGRGLKIATIPESLVMIHNDRVGNRVRTTRFAATRAQGARYVIDNHRAKLEENPKILAKWLALHGVNSARLGWRDAARRSIREALRYDPMNAKYHAYLWLSMFPSISKKVWRLENEPHAPSHAGSR